MPRRLFLAAHHFVTSQNQQPKGVHCRDAGIMPHGKNVWEQGNS